MAPFKMPFSSRRPVANGTAETVTDENTQPQGIDSPYKPSLALGVKERSKEPNEFKMSSVSDSGEYMPPSPMQEKKSFWSKSPPSASNNHRSLLNENEPFSISRESFESYRRSFDISGRSPIIHADSYTSRSSFDSRFSRLPSSSISNKSYSKPDGTDPDFEDVGLNDDTGAKPKKRGFLSRFAEGHDGNTTNAPDAKSSHFSIIPGRKRGQSGSGNEMGSVQQPSNKTNTDAMPR